MIGPFIQKFTNVKRTHYGALAEANINYKRGQRQVPGNDVNGYTSRTYMSPDGTFRIQIPRPDVEKDDDLIVVFDVASDAAIETEKVYREYGENFEGELVEKAKRGKKIIYKLHIEE